MRKRIIYAKANMHLIQPDMAVFFPNEPYWWHKPLYTPVVWFYDKLALMRWWRKVRYQLKKKRLDNYIRSFRAVKIKKDKYKANRRYKGVHYKEKQPMSYLWGNIRIAKQRYGNVIFYQSGRRFDDIKVFTMGILRRLKKRTLLRRYRTIISRWVGSFILRNNRLRLAKATRRVWKTSAYYTKFHFWKFGRVRLRGRAWKRRGESYLNIYDYIHVWVKNCTKRTFYFWPDRVNTRFKLITLREFD